MAYRLGSTFFAVCRRLKMDGWTAFWIYKDLTDEGFAEDYICQAASFYSKALDNMVGDTRLKEVFKNSVRKFAKEKTYRR